MEKVEGNEYGRDKSYALDCNNCRSSHMETKEKIQDNKDDLQEYIEVSEDA